MLAQMCPLARTGVIFKIINTSAQRTFKGSIRTECALVTMIMPALSKVREYVESILLRSRR